MPATRRRAPQVSVIIVTYNHEPWIGRCLESLRAQRDAPPFEVLVVDVGSHDGTLNAVRQGSRHARLLQMPNRGFGAANNEGARHARGTILAFTNPDTIPSPNWVQCLASTVQKGRVVAASPILLRDQPHRINTLGLGLHVTGHGVLRRYRRTYDARTTDMDVPGFSGAGFGVHREDYEKLGGFDEAIFLYNDDTEFSWRVRRSGLTIRLASAAPVLHDYRPSPSADKHYHAERSRRILIRKHFSRGQRLLYAPALIVASFAALVRLGPRRFGEVRRSAAAATPTTAASRGRIQGIACRFLPLAQFFHGGPAVLLVPLANLVFLVNTIGWWRRG